MARSPITSRREVLTGVCGAAAVAVAGCMGGGGDGNGDGSGPSGEDVAAAMGGTSFAYEGGGSMSAEGSTISMDLSGYRTADGDQYMESTSDMMGMEQTQEIYIVDGTTYTVVDGTCSQGTDQSTFVPEADDLDFLSDMEPSGTDTIDGTEVDVYEVSEEQMGENSGAGTIYIDGDNYIRRMEVDFDEQGMTGELSFDFHSYGDSFSVEPPASC